jgi:zinc transport system ATP-binding protein
METRCSPSSIIHLDHASFSYNGKPVITDASLHIAEKEFVWIVGPNGGGKSTLLKLLVGLLKPNSGVVSVFGESPEKVRSRIGYLPQNPSLDSHFPATVLDVALMGRLHPAGPFGRYGVKDKEAALAALDTVGLTDRIHERFSQLSGGQLRRLLIARSLAAEPSLLLLDEPTANLDQASEEELRNLLYRLSSQITVLMVSHDPVFVASFVDKVVCVNRSVSMHPTGALPENTGVHIYGERMNVIRHDRHVE